MSETLRWFGPIPFLQMTNNSSLPPEAHDAGVYVVTVKCDDKYYAHNPGMTWGRIHPSTFAKRFRAKVPECLGKRKKKWWVFDADLSMRGRSLCKPARDEATDEDRQRWANLLFVFLAPLENRHRADVLKIEKAIHWHFRQPPKTGCEVFYDRKQESATSKPIDIVSDFSSASATIEGLP